MDEIHGENAHLDLEYVLTLPTEQASKLRDDLLRQGVSENQIMVKEPGRTSRKPEKSPRVSILILVTKYQSNSFSECMYIYVYT